MLAHYEVTGSTITKYYFAGTQRIAMRQGATLYYLLSDHLGSASIVTDASGQVISQTKYKAWGEVRYSSGSMPTQYQFTGQYSYAGEFGLLFYNARFYDPSLSRFVSADSIVPAGVQGLDRYAYVNNSPMNYVDPSGHISCTHGNLPEDECNNGDVGLSSGARKLLKFSEKFGLEPEDVIIAALAGESGGWANDANIMKSKEEAWGLRYQWYVKTFCYGADSQNCKLNFYMAYSQSVRDRVENLWDAPNERVQSMISEGYYGEPNWDAGKQLYNAVQNPRPEWVSFDPDHNPADRNRLFDVGILGASVTNRPTTGGGYNEFYYFARTIYEGKDSYSVILTYCQWQYWTSNQSALSGCYPANP